MNENQITSRPGCQQWLEPGYIVSNSGLHWSPSKEIGKHFVPNMKTDMMYPENEGAFLQNPRFASQRCRSCGIAVIRYSE